MELSRQDTVYINRNKLQNLLSEVMQRHIYPEDKFEIAAILEANGWNDDRAAEEFGTESVFELAEDLWRITQEKLTAQPFTLTAKMSAAAYTAMVIRSFLRGMIMGIPIAVSVFAMLTLRFSLWSFENLSVELATSIAIGTIMSFMATGGFTQAIARRGFLYIGFGYYHLARRITFYFVRLGYVLCFLFAVFFLLFNLFFDIFPLRMTSIVVAYFFFLSTIWLSVTIMYVLEKELIFTGLMCGGIGLVFIFHRIYQVNIIASQLIALVTVSIAGAFIVLYFFSKVERQTEKGISNFIMPRTSITIYTVLPYFAYGFLYFSFLFIDRIIAWSTNTIFMPYLIWFRGPYELGLDLALLALIIPMGFIEVIVSEIMANMEPNQKNYMGIQASRMNKEYLRIYLKRIVIVAAFSLVSAVIIYFGIRYIHLIPFSPIKNNLLINNTTQMVFSWALLGYVILSVALTNALVLFSLSQPDKVSYAILWAILGNLLVGFTLSRWIDHSFAVFGLIIGSVIFLYLTSREVIIVLKNLDYYLYTAS